MLNGKKKGSGILLNSLRFTIRSKERKQDDMPKRFVSIWFRHLETDWFTLRRTELHGCPFVLATPDHGRMVITSANAVAQEQGISKGVVVADARAIIPSLKVLDHPSDLAEKILKRIAEWCIRYTPVVSIDLPDGLILDATGCAHLWGGEELYLQDIVSRLKKLGYTVRVAIADTIGTAWAVARYGRGNIIINSNPGVVLLATTTLVRCVQGHQPLLFYVRFLCT